METINTTINTINEGDVKNIIKACNLEKQAKGKLTFANIAISDVMVVPWHTDEKQFTSLQINFARGESIQRIMYAIRCYDTDVSVMYDMENFNLIISVVFYSTTEIQESILEWIDGFIETMHPYEDHVPLGVNNSVWHIIRNEFFNDFIINYDESPYDMFINNNWDIKIPIIINERKWDVYAMPDGLHDIKTGECLYAFSCIDEMEYFVYESFRHNDGMEIENYHYNAIR